MNKDYQQEEGFWGGKGFYIAMLVCVSVVALSAWAIWRNVAPEEEEAADTVIQTLPPEYDHQWRTEPVYEPERQEDELEEVGELTPEEPATQVLGPAEPEVTPQPTPVPALNERVYLWPVQGTVQMPYSMAALSYDETMGDWRTHDGIDICTDAGTQVKCCSDGVVEQVFSDPLYGTTVAVSHGQGLMSYYANLQETVSVQVGQHLHHGDNIGLVGDTALCESSLPSHLHFAMSLEGNSVDPKDYMPVL